ncbi:MAG: hypothetical protein ABIG84_08005 [archaeon]
MERINKEEILFLVTKEDMQNEAVEKFGRRLTEEELNIAREGLENGLTFDIGTVYNTILFEMIENTKN